MRAEDIKKVREEAPFKPFTVFLSDQRRFEIRHPDFIWVVPGGRTIGIADQNGLVDWIDVVHVTGIKREGEPRS